MTILLMLTTIIYFIILLLFFIGLFFPNKKRQQNKPSVSVVIAARNEQHNIANILHDLTIQSYPADMYEIIIVDDHSTDNTVKIIEQFAANHHNIRLIRALEDDSGRLTAKKNAIQQGIKSSRGEIILTTDADCRVQTRWIEVMVSYFTDDIGMVVGFSQMGRKGEKYTLFEQLQAIDFLALLSAAQGSLNINYPLAATGQNLAYRKQAFEQVGGFEEIGHRISGDDVLLLQLIHKKTDWKICFAPAKETFNSTFPEKTFRGLLNQRKRWASNGSYQFILNKGFFFIVFNTFLLNLLFLIYFFLPVNRLIGLGCLAAKFLIEFLVTARGAIVYNRTDLLKYYPLWVILQIPYVVVVGLSGNIGKFVWKGRKQGVSV